MFLPGSAGVSPAPSPGHNAKKDPDVRVRAACLWALGELGDAAVSCVPAVCVRLNETDPAIRAAAAGALGKLTHDLCLPALTRACRDREPEVRREAATALGRKPGEAAGVAMASLGDDPDGTVRAAAVLARLGEPAAVAIGAALAERDDRLSSDEIVLWVDTLAEVGVPSARAMLDRWAQHPSASVRDAVKRARRGKENIRNPAPGESSGGRIGRVCMMRAAWPGGKRNRPPTGRERFAKGVRGRALACTGDLAGDGWFLRTGRATNMRVQVRSESVRTVGWVAGIMVAAAAFRFHGLNWDQGCLLHPDERFLVMVTEALAWPRSLAQYLSPSLSPLNPQAAGHAGFVYGMLPTTLLRLVGDLAGIRSLDGLALAGRALMAAADTITALLVFLLADGLGRLRTAANPGGAATGEPCARERALLAAMLYALAVHPIQQAHFFTADTLMCSLTTLSAVLLLRFAPGGGWGPLLLSAVAAGAALGTKLSAALILPWLLVIPLAAAPTWRRGRGLGRTAAVFAAAAAAFALVAGGTFHFVDPKSFADASLLDFRPNPRFVEGLRWLVATQREDGSFPPTVQWVGTPPVWFALKNMALAGLGPVYLACTALGAARLLRHGSRSERALVVFVLAFFLYQSCQLVKPQRYFALLYPYLALLAADGLMGLRRAVAAWRPRAAMPVAVAAGMAILAWPLLFSGIYTRPHTRVTASRWIYRHVPAGSTILAEHWDDPLPLPCDGRTPAGLYDVVQMPVFDPFCQAKLDTINGLLQTADYLVLSSNRGYGAIPRQPMRYPFMTEFYRRLFAGETAFRPAAEFTSYPGWRIGGRRFERRDDGAEEPFTVYDHPRVLIFRKEPRRE